MGWSAKATPPCCRSETFALLMMFDHCNWATGQLGDKWCDGCGTQGETKAGLAAAWRC